MTEDTNDFVDSVIVEELNEVSAELLAEFETLSTAHDTVEVCPEIDFWAMRTDISKHDLKR